MATVIPNLVWAQRPDRVFITVQQPDIQNPTVTYSEDGVFYFKGVSTKDGRTYEVTVPLYAAIDVEGSRHQATTRSIEVNLKRKESGDYWPRLTKEGGKYHYIKVDWDKWRDEDEEAEEEKFDVNKFGGMGGMGGMGGGFPGMGGMGGGFPGMGGGFPGMDGGFGDDEDDEDDEGDLPDLEATEPDAEENEEADKPE